MAGRRKGQVHIGTSGWTYEHWLGRFYPEEAKGESPLRQYARAFKSVEINATFYRMPSERAMDNWLAETPDDFLFAVKASRYIAHRKRLKDPEIHVPIFTTRILRMKPKLGPVLYQLPPSLAANLDRLKALLDRLPDGVRYTTEYRHESWWTEEVYACLRAHGIAFCLFHLAGRETPEIVTADSVYIRCTGRAQPIRARTRTRHCALGPRRSSGGWAKGATSISISTMTRKPTPPKMPGGSRR